MNAPVYGKLRQQLTHQVLLLRWSNTKNIIFFILFVSSCNFAICCYVTRIALTLYLNLGNFANISGKYW